MDLTHETEHLIGHKVLSTVDIFVTALNDFSMRDVMVRLASMYQKPMLHGYINQLESAVRCYAPSRIQEYHIQCWGGGEKRLFFDIN